MERSENQPNEEDSVLQPSAPNESATGRVVAWIEAETSRAIQFLVSVALLAVGAVIARWGYPTAIWRDGWFYLSSARSLFTPDIAEQYYWIREPAYPMMLRVIAEVFGSSDSAIVILQSFLITGAILAVGACLGLLSSRIALTATAAVALMSIFTPQYFGYASKILKQPLMIAASACAALVTAKLVRTESLKAWHFLIISLAAFLTSFVSLSVSYVWTGVALVFSSKMSYRVLPGIKARISLRLARWGAVSAVMVGMALGATVLTIVSGDLGREVFAQVRKVYAPERLKNETVADIAETGLAGSLVSSPLETVRATTQNVLSLTMIGATDNPGGVQENVVFTQSQLSEQWLCGLRDDYEPDSWTLRFIEYGDYVDLSCRSASLQELLRDVHRYGGWVYRLQMGVLLAALPYLAIRRNWVAFSVVFPAIWFLLVYSYGVGYTNDRYGLVLYPYAAGVSALILRDVVIATVNLWSRRRAA